MTKDTLDELCKTFRKHYTFLADTGCNDHPLEITELGDILRVLTAMRSIQAFAGIFGPCNLGDILTSRDTVVESIEHWKEISRHES